MRCKPTLLCISRVTMLFVVSDGGEVTVVRIPSHRQQSTWHDMAVVPRCGDLTELRLHASQV